MMMGGGGDRYEFGYVKVGQGQTLTSKQTIL